MNFWHPAAFHLHHGTINQDAAHAIAPKNQHCAVCCRGCMFILHNPAQKKVSYIFCCARS